MIKLGDVVMILDLHRQGLAISAIARELGIDRKTVRRTIAGGLEPIRISLRHHGHGEMQRPLGPQRFRLGAHGVRVDVRV